MGRCASWETPSPPVPPKSSLRQPLRESLETISKRTLRSPIQDWRTDPRRTLMHPSLRLHPIVRCVGLCLVLLFALRIPAGEDGEKRESAALQGNWVVVEAEKDGQPLDRLRG